jgi:hypothetical protein
MPKASIKITINPFADPYAPPTPSTAVRNLLPFDMAETSDPANRVTVSRPTGPGTATGGAGPYVEGVIEVSGKGNIDLTLNVVDTAGAAYTVCGLLFSLIHSTQPNPGKHGKDNFPSFTCIKNGNVTVDNVAAFAATYAFYLLIQNQHGGMAIVDPRMVNR